MDGMVPVVKKLIVSRPGRHIGNSLKRVGILVSVIYIVVFSSLILNSGFMGF